MMWPLFGGRGWNNEREVYEFSLLTRLRGCVGIAASYLGNAVCFKKKFSDFLLFKQTIRSLSWFKKIFWNSWFLIFERFV